MCVKRVRYMYITSPSTTRTRHGAMRNKRVYRPNLVDSEVPPAYLHAPLHATRVRRVAPGSEKMFIETSRAMILSLSDIINEDGLRFSLVTFSSSAQLRFSFSYNTTYILHGVRFCTPCVAVCVHVYGRPFDQLITDPLFHNMA